MKVVTFKQPKFCTAKILKHVTTLALYFSWEYGDFDLACHNLNCSRQMVCISGHTLPLPR